MRVRVYEDDQGRHPFWDWFSTLPREHSNRVQAVVGRLADGHDAGIKSVGAGVLEWRIDWGPGLRLYLARDGDTLIILLGGGTKRRQQADIRDAQDRWADYKRRKTKEK